MGDPETIEQFRFADFVSRKVGTRHWAVAPRLTDRMRRMGYEKAISQKNFTALKTEYEEKFNVTA